MILVSYKMIDLAISRRERVFLFSMKCELLREMTKISCLTHLECTACGEQTQPNIPHTLCPTCGKVLFARYNLEQVKAIIRISKTEGHFTNRSYDIWRYPEIMPVLRRENQISLGEGWTPLLPLKRSVADQGLRNVYLKDEGQNPTGTFKSRGLCVAVSKAIELGVKSFIIPTAGNAGAALAAYTAREGVEAVVVMPEDTPQLLQSEVRAFGSEIKLVPGTIRDAAAVVQQIKQENNYFDVSTLKEPYRVEGKKTMAYEVVEQLRWQVPDVIIYPTGGGTGIVGMWKAFQEMKALEMIGTKKPRMVAVQSSGCAPIVKAFNQKEKNSDVWKNASTIAPGLRVPHAIGDYLILEAIYESNGTAIALSDKAILLSMKELAKKEGIMLAPEAAAPYAALTPLMESDFLEKDETIILFGTGSGLVYPELW
ncbi:MAG: threonine synthase [Candidatus Hodarchaeales archaeon]